MSTPLFPGLPEARQPVVRFKQLRRPLWTENKARLIERYLFHFVLITHHGAFIDGFSAPQYSQDRKIIENWAAKLVLESKPQLLRDIWLCDLSSRGVAALNVLVEEQPSVAGRKIRVLSGDFNERIDDILSEGRIREKTAAFCLLDQRTFECEWETVRKIAQHKPEGAHKIELFYFLATGWFGRSIKATTKTRERIDRWWGSSDWSGLLPMKGLNRALLICDRFKNEFGYRYAHPWPIYDRGQKGKVMYHMIHCSDHPEAPKLMYRSYRKATAPGEDEASIQNDFDKFWGSTRVERTTRG